MCFVTPIARTQQVSQCDKLAEVIGWTTLTLLLQKVERWTRTWNSVVAGKRTHGPTIQALKLTPQEAAPGAESAVYDCLVNEKSPRPLLLAMVSPAFEHGSGKRRLRLFGSTWHSVLLMQTISCCADSPTSTRLETTSRQTQPHVAQSHWIRYETTEHRTFLRVEEDSLSRTLALDMATLNNSK